MAAKRTKPKPPQTLDVDTANERDRLNLGKPEGYEGPAFSCPVPGCTVRVSHTNDDGVVFCKEVGQWFCGDQHRRSYLTITDRTRALDRLYGAPS